MSIYIKIRSGVGECEAETVAINTQIEMLMVPGGAGPGDRGECKPYKPPPSTYMGPGENETS